MPRASATSLTLVLPKPRATTSRQVALRISSRRTLALTRATSGSLVQQAEALPRRRSLARPAAASAAGPAELGEALREFGRSRMLPRVAYTSERVLAFEMERLFAGSWVCVARAEDLWDPGDQLAAQIGEVGVLVVRD